MPRTTTRPPKPPTPDAPSSGPEPSASTSPGTAAEQGITIVAIRHIGNPSNPCNYESRPPQHILDQLMDGTWGGGLSCVRCNGYAPVTDFEMVPA